MLIENINVIRLQIAKTVLSYFTNIFWTAVKTCSELLGCHVKSKFGSQYYLVTKILHSFTQQLFIVTISISI
ncbi:hypothetical protein D3C75_955790 [compost metagenome]